MKGLCVLLTAVCLGLLMSGPVQALTNEELLTAQWEASGVEELYDTLPEETKDLLERLGVESWTWDAWQSMDTQRVWSTLYDLLGDATDVPWKAAFTTLCSLIMLGVYHTLSASSFSQSAVVRLVGMLAVTAPLLIPLWQTIERVHAAADSAGVFCLSFAPVYAGILAASGNTVSAVSYQSAMLVSAQGIGLLIGSVIVPLLGMALALGLIGSIHTAHRIGEVASAINKTAVWLLGISMTVFVGMLSLRGIVAATADSIGGRMMRFSVAGFVPVVGGSLSEALYAVRGCLSTLRGTVGSFGLLAVILIALPTWVECVVWGWLLFLCKTAAALFGFPELEGTLSIAQGIMRTMNGILASLAVLMIISVTILSLAGGGIS